MADLRVGDAISTAFRTAMNVGAFMRTQGLVVLAVAVLTLIVTLAVQGTMWSMMSAAFANEDPEAMFGAIVALLPIIIGFSLLYLAIAVVVTAIGTGVGMRTADALLAGAPAPSFAEAWALIKPRLGNLIVTSLLVIAIFMGVMLAGVVTFFLVIPIFLAFGLIIYLAVRWFPVLAVSAFETRGATDNLRRASELTTGKRGAVLGTIVVMILIFIGVALVISVPVTLALEPTPDTTGMTPQQALEASRPSTTYTIASWAVNTVIQLFASFVGSALMVHVYRRLSAPAAPLPGEAWPAPPPTAPPAP